MRIFLNLGLLFLLGCNSAPRAPGAQVAASGPASPLPPPAAPVSEQRPVTDVYHGVSVTDAYRWLEAGDDAAVKSWSEAQNTYSRRMLEQLPGVSAIRERLSAVYSTESPSFRELESVAGSWFVRMAAPPRQQRTICARKTAPGSSSATSRIA